MTIDELIDDLKRERDEVVAHAEYLGQLIVLLEELKIHKWYFKHNNKQSKNKKADKNFNKEFFEKIYPDLYWE